MKISDLILTERPANMSHAEFRTARTERNKRIRNYLKKGSLFYVASELIPIKDSDGKISGYKKVNYPPFRGSVKLSKIVKEKA